jgi:hypothetical protein
MVEKIVKPSKGFRRMMHRSNNLIDQIELNKTRAYKGEERMEEFKENNHIMN